MLPVRTLKYVIPLEKDVSNIKIIRIEETDIKGNYMIMPAQPPMPMQTQFTSSPFIKDSLFYRTNAFYPQEPFGEIETGFMVGTKVCSFKFFPVRYNPKTQKIKLITRIEFEFEYKTDNKDFCFPFRLSELSQRTLQKNIKSMLNNPDDFNARSALPGLKGRSGGSSATGIDYVIITHDSLSAGFQEIADWKTKKGLPSKVVTTDWIYGNFSGVDGAEKVHAFIKYAFQNWGSIWFLLGGDTEIVPVRSVWIGPYNSWLKEYRPKGVFMPTDTYYACLDGNWNADGDATFGEGSYDRKNDGSLKFVNNNANIDGVDRERDVFVGRIPVKTNRELNNYKMKYFNYAKNPTNAVTNAFLFYRNIAYSYEMEYVKNTFPSHISVDRAYEDAGGTKLNVLNALNGTTKKYHILCGYGHGAVHNFDACDDVISRDEISNLQNSDNTGIILYNNHCETLTWDKDCVGKRFTLGVNGGIVYIGNTHFGWTGDLGIYNKPFIDTLYNHQNYSISESFFNATKGNCANRVNAFNFSTI